MTAQTGVTVLVNDIEYETAMINGELLVIDDLGNPEIFLRVNEHRFKGLDPEVIIEDDFDLEMILPDE